MKNVNVFSFVLQITLAHVYLSNRWPGSESSDIESTLNLLDLLHDKDVSVVEFITFDKLNESFYAHLFLQALTSRNSELTSMRLQWESKLSEIQAKNAHTINAEKELTMKVFCIPMHNQHENTNPNKF